MGLGIFNSGSPDFSKRLPEVQLFSVAGRSSIWTGLLVYWRPSDGDTLMQRDPDQQAFDETLANTAPELDTIAQEELSKAQDALADTTRDDTW